MKIRTGFISNSSSSSFIVANDHDDLKLTVEIDISKYIKHILMTKEDLKKYMVKYWANSEEELNEYFKEIYLEMLKSIENGKIVYIGSVCNYKDESEHFIYNNGLLKTKNNFDVIANIID